MKPHLLSYEFMYTTGVAIKDINNEIINFPVPLSKCTAGGTSQNLAVHDDCNKLL
jgi:hypothetical protein